MNMLEIAVEVTGKKKDVAVIRPAGLIDTNTVNLVTTTLQKTLSGGQVKIVFDLENVTYISSAGWGVFIGEIRNIREKRGDLKLDSMLPEVEVIYKVLEFDSILKAYGTVDDALQDFS
jgi:anti-sigma B factor antagonist